MWLDSHRDQEISGRFPLVSRDSLTGQPDDRAIANTRGHSHVNLACTLLGSRAAAPFTRASPEMARPAAGLAGLWHLQPQAPATAIECLSEGNAELAGNVSRLDRASSGTLPEGLLKELANISEGTYLIRIIVSIVNAMSTFVLTAGPWIKAGRFVRLGMLPVMSVLVVLSPLFEIRQDPVGPRRPP